MAKTHVTIAFEGVDEEYEDNLQSYLSEIMDNLAEAFTINRYAATVQTKGESQTQVSNT